MNKTIITTSWDDGSREDLRVSRLLNTFNLKGTFYVLQAREFRSLTDEEIKELSKTQEIGAHTLNHYDLTKLSLVRAKKQIIGSKKNLEDILHKPIKMFCYPKGKYNSEIKEIVQEANFLGARTTKEFSFREPKDFFEFGAALHVYPFPLRKRDREHYHLSRFLFQPLGRKFFKILKLGLPFSSFLNWPNLAKALFDYVYKNGGIYHLWGHSWEVERYGMWLELEDLFRYISRRENVLYLTNGQALEFFRVRPSLGSDPHNL